MPDVRVDLATPEGPHHVDLCEWLRARGVDAKLGSDPVKMGTAETISMILTGTSLPGAMLVVREWVKARRRTVQIKTPDIEITVSASTSDTAFADLVQQIQSHSSVNGRADE